jgi:hypothetical protein
MKLAKAKNIIRYAVLGKFRLLQILRQIENYEEQDDPVGAYLEANGVDFNPEEETNFEDVKFKTEVAINYHKLLSAGLNMIKKNKVEALVRNGKEIEGKHIKDMVFLKNAKTDAKADVIKYFDELIASDEKPEPVLTGERKALIFKKTANKFLMVIDNAIADAEYLGEIDQEFYDQLKEKVVQLERFVIPN